jgi:predicted dehydrogenase
MAANDLDPSGPPGPVCGPGDFPFAAVGLDHPHIHAMCEGLAQAGGELRLVYDRDATKTAALLERFPGAAVADSEAQVLEAPEIALVASSIVPSERAALGMRVMDSGKDYFVDKGPFTSLAQLALARAKAAETGRKYLVYFGERLHVECAVFAAELVEAGILGRVVQVLGLGPHRLGLNPRPAWFFEKEHYGGILCDIASHQFEQVLFFGGASRATVEHARVENFGHPERPELEDFGEASVVTDTGTSGYVRVDWFTPDGLRAWGDGRLLLLGTEGTLELRKYVDVARGPGSDHIYLVTSEGERYLQVQGKVGFPFFGRLILDCLNRTESAMTQAHAFAAAELALQAQDYADRARAPAARTEGGRA